jgi:RNA polymerase sigma-70 factor (ECF subfamily)
MPLQPGKPPAQGLSDAEMVGRIVAGDPEAFRALMRRYNQTLYRTARAILKDDAEAEDAVQEAYLLAYGALEQFRGDAKLSTWLVRIAANEAIGRLRKRARSAEVIRLEGESSAEGEATEMSTEQATPEQPDQGAQRAEARRLLERKLDELPDAFRAVFVLRAVEEMTVEETAIALDIPEATVRSRFFRAKGLLRESLARDIDVATGDAFSFAGERCDRIVANTMERIFPTTTGDQI